LKSKDYEQSREQIENKKQKNTRRTRTQVTKFKCKIKSTKQKDCWQHFYKYIYVLLWFVYIFYTNSKLQSPKLNFDTQNCSCDAPNPPTGKQIVCVIFSRLEDAGGRAKE